MAFAPFIIILMVSLGFDTVTAIGTMILGYAIGYGAGFLNPFNLAVAQGIAGLPYPSGMGYRIGLSLILYVVAVRYMIHYAKKVHKNPGLSLSPEVRGIRDGYIFLYQDDRWTYQGLGYLLCRTSFFNLGNNNKRILFN